MKVHKQAPSPKTLSVPETVTQAVSPPKTGGVKIDVYTDKNKVTALMDNALRADSGGVRPRSKMSSPPTVALFTEAASHSPAPGAISRALLKRPDDAALEITRTDLDEGARTPSVRSANDQRVLIEGFGTLMLDGVQTPLRPGDMVLLPKGTRNQFIAEKPGGLKLWSVATDSAEAPMKRAAGVLPEDTSKEFFVGEGVQILERANSEADPAAGFDRCRVPAGMTTAEHRCKIDERYLITSGEGTVVLDGVKRHVQAGDVVLIPQGTTQSFVAGESGVTLYSVTTPRFLVEDYDVHVKDAFVDPKLYDGSAGPLAEVEAKLQGR